MISCMISELQLLHSDLFSMIYDDKSLLDQVFILCHQAANVIWRDHDYILCHPIPSLGLSELTHKQLET